MSNRPSRLNERTKNQEKLMQKLWFQILMGILVVGLVIFLVAGFMTGWTFGLAIGGDGKITTSQYGINIYDISDADDLNIANISYWDVDADGLPDDMLAFGDQDNITMQTWAFEAGESYWGKVEMLGYQDKWIELNIDDQNDVYLWKLPTISATIDIIPELGGTWVNITSDNGTITIYFDYSVDNGTGFEPSYDAIANETIYLEYVFVFNTTTITVDTIVLPAEIGDDKVAIGSVLTIPVTTSFLCGKDGSSNKIITQVEVELPTLTGLFGIGLFYDGVLYASVSI